MTATRWVFPRTWSVCLFLRQTQSELRFVTIWGFDGRLQSAINEESLQLFANSSENVWRLMAECAANARHDRRLCGEHATIGHGIIV